MLQRSMMHKTAGPLERIFLVFLHDSSCGMTEDSRRWFCSNDAEQTLQHN